MMNWTADASNTRSCTLLPSKYFDLREMNTFGLLENPVEAPQDLSRQTHAALDESAEIFGRDGDKEVCW